MSFMQTAYYGLLLGALSADGCIADPPAAHIRVPENVLQRFDQPKLSALERYLATRRSWDLCPSSEARGWLAFKHLNRGEEGVNGFCSGTVDSHPFSYRVVIAYAVRVPHGLTCTTVTAAPVVAILPMTRNRYYPIYESCLVVQGPLLRLYVYENSADLQRRFSSECVDAVSNELREVLTHLKTVARTGLLPAASAAAEQLPTTPSLRIVEGPQPGIYRIRAALRTTLPGVAYVRVYEGDKPIFPRRIERQSLRVVGWDEAGKYCFPYCSQVTLYGRKLAEGAVFVRFELWHRTVKGTETRMAVRQQAVRKWRR